MDIVTKLMATINAIMRQWFQTVACLQLGWDHLQACDLCFNFSSMKNNKSLRVCCDIKIFGTFFKPPVLNLHPRIGMESEPSCFSGSPQTLRGTIYREKDGERSQVLLLTQMLVRYTPCNAAYSVCVCVCYYSSLTCGGPQPCWWGPLRWRWQRLNCERSDQPERSRPTLLSLLRSSLPTHIQTSRLWMGDTGVRTGMLILLYVKLP